MTIISSHKKEAQGSQESAKVPLPESDALEMENKNSNDSEIDITTEKTGDKIIVAKNEQQPGQEEERGACSNIAKFRNWCGMVVTNSYVQLVIVTLIGINAIMMGIATYSFVRENPKLLSIFEGIDEAFLIIFTVELAFQFVFLLHRLFLDGWLVFDFLVIVLSWSFNAIQVIRAFRIFRALRLITRIKTMKNLVSAMFSVMPSLGAIMLLLLLIFYIFAVMFTQLFKTLGEVDPELPWPYFDGLDQTFFTLFQIMTFDNWGSICREVMVTYPWAWVPFLIFLSISGLVVINLIIAVLCDAVSNVEDGDKEKLQGLGSFSEDDDSNPELSSRRILELKHVREQMLSLEEELDSLERTQEKNTHTLEYLTRQLQKRNATRRR
mmetsp:Transcript_18733/g.27707  ORF Transcript_18733/g.27707 Transcript_18733/m.27707 type:complete len:381 (+) Transcript_18733:94-1236(+)|eukprot:CAMPEP_0194206004 /NCGR_PEP_ID=MMETSP0156-20130528/5141_1 /TAXON_ID=33649 /ORGANISM="Thalassionema nitzschioides, Strain L26-B" /LENGTH=380 /DNA_ID=CAMNT_0038932419 /DNA_START=35 /DNA_END=1177 /DNA_ORIENTATION=+